MAGTAPQANVGAGNREGPRVTDWSGARSPDKNITSCHVSRIHSAQFKVGVVFTLHLQLASVSPPEPSGDEMDYRIRETSTLRDAFLITDC